MRKRVVPFIHRCLEHLKQATIRAITPSRRSRLILIGGGVLARAGAGAAATTPGFRGAALPANSAALKDLLATIEKHLEFGIANDAALARGRALHDFDVFALELEKLRGHLPNRLSRLAGLGAASDWPFELA